MSKKAPQLEGNGEVRKETIKPERLASLFSSSRDFSLSGKTNQRAQTNKKSYAPNLNVARNKNTEKANEKESKRDQRSDRGKNPRGRGGRGANNASNRGRSNMIQTVGFLSEGIAAAPVGLRNHYGGGGGSSRESHAVEALQKPRIVNRDQKPQKADLDAEQKTMTDLLGEGGDDELDLDDDDSKTSSSDDVLPIKIKDPSRRSNFLTSKKLSTDVKIKTEPVDDDVAMAISDSPDNSQINGLAIKSEPGVEVKSESFHRMDKLFDATANEFMLFQMPDTLPGRAPEAMDTVPGPSSSTSKSQQPNLCSLEHLEEGLVGKLVRYKSGKTKLVLGDTFYDVDLGLSSDFQQHAVTINTNVTERSANMYSLGPINGKYNVSPDWIHLFHKMTP